MVTKQTWIPVQKELPKSTEYVLAYSEGADRIYLCRLPTDCKFSDENYNEHWSVCQEQDCTCVQPTAPISHWMPLPEKPKK